MVAARTAPRWCRAAARRLVGCKSLRRLGSKRSLANTYSRPLSRRALLRRLHHLQRVACQQWYTSPPAPASAGGGNEIKRLS
jgi:hypothetical protein